MDSNANVAGSSSTTRDDNVGECSGSNVENRDSETKQVEDDDDLLSRLADFEFSSSDCEGDSSSKPKLSKYQLLKAKNAENVRKWNEMIKSGDVIRDCKLPPLSSFYELPEPKQKIVRGRHLDDTSAVFDCNAWDDIQWDEEQKSQAEKVVGDHAKSKMTEERKEQLEADAHRFWDEFYGIHKNKFFRDRNWLFSEFPELESPFGASVDPQEAANKLVEIRSRENYPGQNSKFKVLEVGCGVGNTVFPLLSSNNNPHLYVYCCDFAPHAVEIVEKEPHFDAARCTPFVLDITDPNPKTPFPENSLDVITAIFVVSAISPAKFTQVVKNFYKFLKPGGLVLFRDYGRYDLAQLRFKDGRCIEDNFYMRGDGTRVYFFTEEELENMFCSEGFQKKVINVDRRLQVNRGKQLKMYRVWVQGKFQKT